MIRSRGPLRALPTASLRWSVQGEPVSADYDDCYFSAEDGLAETRYVFIEGSNLTQRLRQHSRSFFCIGELGFGTGLNFLETWRVFRQHAPANLRLHYWSIDRQPLNLSDLQRALDRWPELAAPAQELVGAYPPPLSGVHRRNFDAGRVVLDLVWADAAEALSDLGSLEMPLVDAWYLDGFAPSRNDAMWAPALFQHMAAASQPDASVATYSAAGSVRRGLGEAGFGVSKHPGFGRKRECLRGTLTASPRTPTSASGLTPWDIHDSAIPDAPQVLVLGAGLAGAHVAAALARRGLTVCIVDAGECAGRGSGNAQGILFTRLSHERSLLSDFSLLAFLHARQRYTSLFAEGRLREGIDGALSGCVHSEAPRGDFAAMATALQGLEAIAELRSADDINELLGVSANTPGFWLPGSGWLSPPAVCRALLEHEGIRLIENCGPLRLGNNASGQWLALDREGREIASADVAVIAAGTACREFAQLGELPLRVVRGQTTQIPAPAAQPLQASLCHRGYIAPARGGEHCIGATFSPGDESRELRLADHQANLDALAAAIPGWQGYLDTLQLSELAGRAELRCVSPDYLPLAGRVPDADRFIERFSAFQYDAKQHIANRGPYQRGLFVSTAHGSRGLSYAALGAELIASQIAAEPPPVSRELQRALSPARFVIRDLMRNKPRPLQSRRSA